MPDHSDEQIVKSPENARQGRRGVGLIYVLAAGVALAVIAFALTALLGPR